jgi:hypothetical protein
LYVTFSRAAAVDFEGVAHAFKVDGDGAVDLTQADKDGVFGSGEWGVAQVAGLSVVAPNGLPLPV